jgi:hypothetical protein
VLDPVWPQFTLGGRRQARPSWLGSQVRRAVPLDQPLPQIAELPRLEDVAGELFEACSHCLLKLIQSVQPKVEEVLRGPRAPRPALRMLVILTRSSTRS